MFTFLAVLAVKTVTDIAVAQTVLGITTGITVYNASRKAVNNSKNLKKK